MGTQIYPPTRRCANCEFWVRGEHALYPLAYSSHHGECRRLPPSLRIAVGDSPDNRPKGSRDTSPEFVFPTVHGTLWCGEFQMKVKE